MPKSDDISALYDQFSGNANSFHEIGRTARVVEASARWPLFSQMAQERGAAASSAGDQTLADVTQHRQNEPAPQATPPDSETQLLSAALQRSNAAAVPDLRDVASAPSVWNLGRRLITKATAKTVTVPTIAIVPPAMSWPMSGTSPEAAESSPAKHESQWLDAPTAQLAPATPSLKPTSMPKPLSTAASQTPLRPPSPALPPAHRTSPQSSTSPLRRLVRADPPVPHSDASNNVLLTEDLASVFSRLADHPSR